MNSDQKNAICEKWKIDVAGYGTFDFEGTEQQAEEMRRHKANWERGVGRKWRASEFQA